jgi:hypothetical protein
MHKEIKTIDMKSKYRMNVFSFFWGFFFKNCVIAKMVMIHKKI